MAGSRLLQGILLSLTVLFLAALGHLRGRGPTARVALLPDGCSRQRRAADRVGLPKWAVARARCCPPMVKRETAEAGASAVVSGKEPDGVSGSG
jgi:hypothetical protein